MDAYIEGKYCACCPVDFQTQTLISKYPTYYIQRYRYRGKTESFLKCQRCGSLMMRHLTSGWARTDFQSRQFNTADGSPVKE